MLGLGDAGVREIANGQAALINFFIVIMMVAYLARVVMRDGFWHTFSVKLYSPERNVGTAIAIAMFVYFLGASVRAIWIWAQLYHQNRGYHNGPLNSLQEIRLLAAPLIIVGGLCMIRVLLNPRWGRATWFSAGGIMLILPIAIHYWS